MGNNLSDITQFFQQLEKRAHKGPLKGTLKQEDAQKAYKDLLKDSPDLIPQAVKDKFKNGLNKDTFQSIDKLGSKDNLINDEELYASLGIDKNFKPWMPDHPGHTDEKQERVFKTMEGGGDDSSPVNQDDDKPVNHGDDKPVNHGDDKPVNHDDSTDSSSGQRDTGNATGKGDKKNDVNDVYVVDDFIAETDPSEAGFNHGETVSGIVGRGGVDPSLADKTKVHKVNVDSGNPYNREMDIANGLDQVIKAAKEDPNSVDAVNLSQGALKANAGTKKVQEKIKELEAMGIPVVIAAANNGPNNPNQLANPNSIVVGATEGDGTALSDSGPGNVQVYAPDARDGSGRQTSFATPELTPMIADWKAQGLSPAEIKAKLAQVTQQGSFYQGGSVENVFSDPDVDTSKSA